jgi:tRNA-dihydrouridine synthase B
VDLAERLVGEAGVAAIGFHPRSAAVHHKGVPDYELAARLVESLDAPVILTGGLHDAEGTLDAFQQTGAAAVMLARGSLGNPWLFEELLGGREAPPTRAEVIDELDWTIDRAVEHLGRDRAARYLRKFYPWYVARLGLQKAEAKELGESLQRSPTLEDARYTAALAALKGAAIPA